MTTPLTPFEETGEWTSLQAGDAFLYRIAAETDATIEVIGQSYLGRELLMLTIGTGDNVFLVTSGVHGDEPAPRDMVLIKARDMAYDTSTEMTEYLKKHKIIFIPTVNPDRLFSTRNNAQNRNIARDAFALDTPEQRAVSKVIMAVRPHMYLDAHERHGVPSANDIEILVRMNWDGNASSWVVASEASLFDFVSHEMASAGINMKEYPFPSHRGSLTLVGITGGVEILFETELEDPNKAHRVAMQKAAFESVVNWHIENSDTLNMFRPLIDSTEANLPEKYTLWNGGDRYDNSDKLVIKIPKAYKVHNARLLRKWIDIYNIEVTADGTVPLNQRSWPILPRIFDTKSDDCIAVADRIENGRNTKTKTDEWRPVHVGPAIKTEKTTGIKASSWNSMSLTSSVAVSENRTYGWAFSPKENIELTGLSIYAFYDANYTVALWKQSTAEKLAEVVIPAANASWKETKISESVTLEVGTEYVIGFSHPTSAGRNTYRFLNNPDVENDIHMLIEGLGGRFASAQDTMPTTNSTRYGGICGFSFTHEA